MFYKFKSIIKLALLLTFIFYSEESKTQNSKIKSEKSTSYKAELIDGKITKGRPRLKNGTGNMSFSYDIHGNIIEELALQNYGLFMYRKTFSYDSIQRLIKEELFYDKDHPSDVKIYNYQENKIIETSFQPDDEDPTKLILIKNKIKIYDKFKNLIEIKEAFGGERFKSKKVLSYDPRKNKTKEELYSSESEIYYSDSYEYDKNDNLKEKTSFDHMDGTTTKELYKYNNKGKEIERKLIRDNTEPYSKIVSKYNSNDYLVEKSEYIKDNILSMKHIFERDKKGNILYEKKIRLGRKENKLMPEYEFFFEFDKNENIIFRKIIGYDNNGEVSENITLKFIYEYDNNNNWVKKIKYMNDLPRIIIEKEITYFD